MNAWPELSADISAQVESAVASGNKIEAIKIYRTATHCGLKEAKDAIERAGKTAPGDPAIARTNGPNWLVIAIAAIIVLLALATAPIQMNR